MSVPSEKDNSSAEDREAKPVLDWFGEEVRKTVEVRDGSRRRIWRAGAGVAGCLLLAVLLFVPVRGLFSKGEVSSWEDPSLKEGVWVRTNIHTHTRHYDIPRVLDFYREKGYGALAITEWERYADKQHRRDLEEMNTPPDFSTIPGSETGFRTRGRHILIVGSDHDYASDFHLTGTSDEHPGDDHNIGRHDTAIDIPSSLEEGEIMKKFQSLVEKAHNDGHFVVIAHPNYYEERWSHRDILSLKGYDAVEIYNALVERILALRREKEEVDLHGQSHLAVDLWDELLSADHRVWGTVGDDFLDLEFCSPGCAWLWVRAASNCRRDLVFAMEHGSFYCSTGVAFTLIGGDGGQIEVGTDRPCEIRFVGREGSILAKAYGERAVYAKTGTEQYVRVEAKDAEGHWAWSQPFFPKAIRG